MIVLQPCRLCTLPSAQSPLLPWPACLRSSWNPWGSINVSANGGVPQAANVTAHVEAIRPHIESSVPDPAFAGILIVDWETWRPLTAENDDYVSYYTEYSARLVRADPACQGWNATRVKEEAKLRFDAGAKLFFSATVNAIRALRPNARLGFYSQGINQDASSRGMQDNTALMWLWQLVDVLAPSIYPQSTNATSEALRIADAIQGAINSVNLLKKARKQNPQTNSRQQQIKLPAVMPYARALMSGNPAAPFNAATLATQVQVAAGLGAEGIILWGASNDYHGNGCATIEKDLVSLAGPTMQKCMENRAACAAAHCSGHGRCVDFTLERLEETCLSEAPASVSCRCDQGHSGTDCATAS